MLILYLLNLQFEELLIFYFVRYYNREAVVISALQVEKHPITTPGPLTMSPSSTRLTKGAMGVYSALQLAKGVSGSLHSANHFTPLTGTPQGRNCIFIIIKCGP